MLIRGAESAFSNISDSAKVMTKLTVLLSEWMNGFITVVNSKCYVRFHTMRKNQFLYELFEPIFSNFLSPQVSSFWVPNHGFLFPARFVVFSFPFLTSFCFSGSSRPPVTANLILFNCGRTRIKIINADRNILPSLPTFSLQSHSLNRLHITSD